MATPLRALIVEDESHDVELLVRELRRSGRDVDFTRVDTAQSMRAALKEREWDVVLSDYNISSFGALAALSLMHEMELDLPFIIVSGDLGEELAVSAMRAGAHDYFLKQNIGPHLLAAIEREMREAGVRRLHARGVAELRRTSEQLALVLRASGFVLYAAEAFGDRQATYISPNVEQLLGYSAQAFFEAKFWQRHIHPDDVKRVLAAFEVIVQTGHGRQEYRFRHANGTWRWMYDEVKVEGDELGNPKLIVGGWADITDRKQVEEQMLVTDRMVTMGSLAAGVAHEINNPLASVMANLDLASAEIADIATGLGATAKFADVDAELRDAQEATLRIRDIVRDLKMLSRPQEEAAGPVDVRPVMESSLRMCGAELRQRAQVVTRYGDTPPVMATESRLGQVFLNLIINAAQAMPEGRPGPNEIRISTHNGEDHRVVIEFADNGSGIPPDVRHRLFQPFFTTKPVGKGTGLGLSICQRIVTSFDGAIELESEVGRGTTFRITLPAYRRVGEFAPPPAAPLPAAGKRGRILVVDDEPLVLRAIQRAVSIEHDVIPVDSGAEVLRRVEAGDRFDVILCDVMMPGMTGPELHAELRRVTPDQADRLIFMTGGAYDDGAGEAVERLPNPRISKPFEFNQLRSLINSRLR